MGHRIRNTPSPVKTNLERPRSSAGNSPKSANIEERYEQLMKEFSEIDTDKNKELTFDEIMNFLTKKQNEEFDFILCQELFARLDKNNDNAVTMEEFIGSWVEVEDLIIKQIKALKKDIQKNKNEVLDHQDKLKKAKETEVIRPNGIMEDSVLTVLVKSAVKIIPTTADGTSNPFAVLECDENTKNTSILTKTLYPIWEEEFVFPVNSKGLDLKITVLSKTSLGNSFCGQVSIPLSLLADQLKHEQYFSLVSEKGEGFQGKVLLELQWIWSKVRYLEDIIEQYEKFVKEDKERIENLYGQLNKLKKPFAHVIEYNATSMTVEKSHTEKSELMVSKANCAKVCENDRFLYQCILLYLFLSTITNFFRSDFLNVRDK